MSQKHAGGRPSKINQINLVQLQKLASYALTDVQIADFFGISVDSIYTYKKAAPEFSEALKTGKEIADGRVVKSLYERALGYSHPEDKIFNNEGEALIVPTTKHYPPDPTSMIFWLKNRNPKEWREESTKILEFKFIYDVVGRVTQAMNRILPEKCPHCRKDLTLREETIKELEQISQNLETAGKVI